MHDDILAIDRSVYARMREVLDLHNRGVRLSLDEAAAHAGVVARAAAPTRQTTTSGGTIAVIPLLGFMTYRSSLFSLIFGGTSTAAFTAEVRRTANDPSVSMIAIVCDSPGGSIDGVDEAAVAVAEAAKRKRVIAVADVMAASAAFWTISNASEIIATPSGRLGSIGALAIHESLAGALDKAGIVRTYIVSSRFKAEGAETEALTTEARAELQRRVDAVDAIMTARIGAGRRVSTERVRADFGQGRVLFARDALRVGLCDRIATLAETLDRTAAGGPRPAGSFAAAADDDLDLRRRRHRLAALARPLPLVVNDDLDRRRQRYALAEKMSRTPATGQSADPDLDRRRRRHQLAEAKQG